MQKLLKHSSGNMTCSNKKNAQPKSFSWEVFFLGGCQAKGLRQIDGLSQQRPARSHAAAWLGEVSCGQSVMVVDTLGRSRRRAEVH